MTLRSTGIVFLTILALKGSACAATAPDESVIQGRLGPGGRAMGKSSDGQSWSIELRAPDVAFELDGAEVLFLNGAPEGELFYVQDEAKRVWRFDLDAGVARCTDHELEFQGRSYRLEAGQSYRFDGRGQLVSRTPSASSRPAAPES